MVDSVRFAIMLSPADAEIIKRSVRMVSVQAGFLLYRVSIGKLPGFKDLCLEVRGSDNYLVVECTAPILLFGNNVAEISNGDVAAFSKRICEIVEQIIGVKLQANDILNADVRWIHFGKNVLMPSAGAVSEVLKFAEKADARANRSTSWVKFQNGNAYHLHTSKYDVILYDKALENKTKRLGARHRFSESHNLLRIEVRLIGRRMIKRFFPTNSYTVGSLFSEEVSQQVVIKAFEMIFNSRLYKSSDFSMSDIEERCAKTPGELLASIGLNYLLKEQGLAATKHILRSSFGTHVWPRYRRLAIEAQAPHSVEYVLSELQRWELIPP